MEDQRTLAGNTEALHYSDKTVTNKCAYDRSCPHLFTFLYFASHDAYSIPDIPKDDLHGTDKYQCRQSSIMNRKIQPLHKKTER